MSEFKSVFVFSPHGYFLAIPLLSSFPSQGFQGLDTEDVGLRSAGLETMILAHLCFAPGDSQHYRSLGGDASFVTIPRGIPILLHTLSVLLLLPFSLNNSRTISLKLMMLFNN